jgi:hypothetical protein
VLTISVCCETGVMIRRANEGRMLGACLSHRRVKVVIVDMKMRPLGPQGKSSQLLFAELAMLAGVSGPVTVKTHDHCGYGEYSHPKADTKASLLPGGGQRAGTMRRTWLYYWH